MTEDLHVLVSAPYMIPEWSRFESIFADHGIRITIAEVEERLEEEQLLPFAGEVDGVICGDDRFSAKVLEAFAPRLKVISKWGTGIDSIDQDAAKSLGIKVFNTPGAFTEPVSDSVMAYILAFARGTYGLDREMKAGKWNKIPGRALHECSLGVVGVGRIGKSVIRRAKVFGMELLGTDIVEIPADFVGETGLTVVELDELLSRADFVSLNCDLNPTSRHLMNSETFRLMKPSAILINTSRGPVIDEQALISALEKGQIAGAALDVFEDEPLPENSPLLQMDRVLLAPHNANSSPEAWERVHVNSIKNLFFGLGLTVPESF
ncbi:MAG: phosphoglycerate dehydrogenase [Anaerolineales bacterium]|nr:phosphoglycerate dehydrogenase [Anaerolineales bacterium]